MKNTLLTPDSSVWLKTHKITNLFFVAGLLFFSATRLLLFSGHLPPSGIAQLIVACIAIAFLIADLWSLHYRAQPFLSHYLVPSVAIGIAFVGIWFVTPHALIWVLAVIPVLFVRLPLRPAVIASIGTIVITLSILILKYSFDTIVLTRLALASGMIIITLGNFLKIINKVNRELSETKVLLENTLQSISQGIAVIGANNRLKLFNQQYCNILNLPRSFIETKPTLPEMVKFQINRGDFKDSGEITPETKSYIESLGINVNEHVNGNYVRKDPQGRYIEVRTNPMPSGDVVRTYTDVSQYKNITHKLQELLDEHQQISKVVLQRVHEQMVESLTELALTRDNETGLHIQRTRLYVRTLAENLRHSERYRELLSDSLIEQITLAAPLHDLGKVGIPDHILLKPGHHTSDETVIMQTHAMLGEKILLSTAGVDHEQNSVFSIASNIAGGHHENWDGSGYPRGLVETDIPLEARLMALADVYDALTTDRIYKKAWTHEDACAEIYRLSGKKFDPDIVAAFSQTKARFLEIAMEYHDAKV